MFLPSMWFMHEIIKLANKTGGVIYISSTQVTFSAHRNFTDFTILKILGGLYRHEVSQYVIGL
jgi:hypothetical protein